MEGSYCGLLFFPKYKYGCRAMTNTGRFCHSSLSGNFFYTMLSRSFLVHQIVLTTRDFEEQMQPPFQLGEISEQELEQYDSKKMAIKGQIYHISQSRWPELRGKRRMEFRY
ncbi:hypothetical protein MTR67_013857 [Solanum verrucosum]|uniref:Uncharacterized protein n=1 Tax=Solanum verrucosum TaxID=315347 RepID=A0AAF0QB72_SOLVR|nr:hypothetical protein MTR67_013857 [Solanum verrucosum]